MKEVNQLSNLLLLSLACWRLTYMLVNEDGPFDLVKRFRELTGVVYDEDGTVTDVGNSPLACMYCTSVWVAVGLVTVSRWGWISKALAVSGLALIVERRR